MARALRSFLGAAIVLAALCSSSAGARTSGGQPVALVTAEQQNQLLAVTLPQGRVVRRVLLPDDPENVIAGPRSTATVAVLSSKAGAVSLLDGRTLRIHRVVRGFVSPHLAAFSPDGRYLFVSDDGSGQLVVVGVARAKIIARLFVGLGAHHLTVNPNGQELWVALGERARSIAIVAVRQPGHPRLLARLAPGFTVHDLAFSPDGQRVWLTSDDEASTHVVSAQTHRLLFSVPAGRPPQHVAFNYQVDGLGDRVWLTSGYGSQIELVDARDGRVLRVRHAPYGSFNLALSGGLVVTASLLNGTLSEFSDTLRPLRVLKVAASTRDVALTVW
jgi:DNA-binding beta-propeller fold protein YncE